MMIRTLLLSSAAVVALATGALAADLPTTKGPPVYAPPPPPPAFTWSGFYLGGQLGYQWGKSNNPTASSVTGVTSLPELAHNDSGIVGGAHAGFNYQVSQFVFGVEGDVDGSSYRGSSSFSPGGGVSISESTRIPIEGSIRGRIGFAFDRVLIYGTGGVEFASVRNSLSANGFGTTLSASSTTGKVGWTAGGGIEYAIDNNWSIRAEYRYVDLGHVNYDISALAGGTPATLSKRVTKNIATAGFSYKFDMFAPPAPVVAKY